MSNSKTKHTPGPWMIKTPTDFIGPFQHIVDKTGWMVANVNSTSSDDMQLERKANARLIAAAPELLEALEWILGNLKRNPLGNVTTKHGGPGTVVDRHLFECKIKAAIKKATGGAE